MNPFYKIKPLYYDREKQRLLKGGYEYNDTNLRKLGNLDDNIEERLITSNSYFLIYEKQ